MGYKLSYIESLSPLTALCLPNYTTSSLWTFCFQPQWPTNPVRCVLPKQTQYRLDILTWRGGGLFRERRRETKGNYFTENFNIIYLVRSLFIHLKVNQLKAFKKSGRNWPWQKSVNRPRHSKQGWLFNDRTNPAVMQIACTVLGVNRHYRPRIGTILTWVMPSQRVQGLADEGLAAWQNLDNPHTFTNGLLHHRWLADWQT